MPKAKQHKYCADQNQALLHMSHNWNDSDLMHTPYWCPGRPLAGEGEVIILSEHCGDKTPHLSHYHEKFHEGVQVRIVCSGNAGKFSDGFAGRLKPNGVSNVDCPEEKGHGPHAWSRPGVHGTLVSYWCVGKEDSAEVFGVPPGSDMEWIINQILPEVRGKMLNDAGEYGFTNHQELGERGQFADIWRKIGKLKRALWDGVGTEAWREKPRTILMDLIGHCLLMIAMMDRKERDAEAKHD